MKRTGLSARALIDLPSGSHLGCRGRLLFIILYISSGIEAQSVPDTEFSYYTSFELLLAHLATCSANLASCERLRSLHASTYKEDESGIGCIRGIRGCFDIIL